MPSWGARIRNFRETQRMTQGGLAELLGVTQTTVSRWEGGRQNPTHDIKIRFAKLMLEHQHPAWRSLSMAIFHSSTYCSLWNERLEEITSSLPVLEESQANMAQLPLNANHRARDELRAMAEFVEAHGGFFSGRLIKIEVVLNTFWMKNPYFTADFFPMQMANAVPCIMALGRPISQARYLELKAERPFCLYMYADSPKISSPLIKYIDSADIPTAKNLVCAVS